MLRVNISKAKSYWKKHGTLGLVKKVVLRTPSFFFSYKPLNFYGISGLPQTELKPRCPLEIRRGRPEDIELMVKMLEYMDGAVARKRKITLLYTHPDHFEPIAHKFPLDSGTYSNSLLQCL